MTPVLGYNQMNESQCMKRIELKSKCAGVIEKIKPPTLLNMQSRSHKATVTLRRRGVASSVM